VGAAWLARAAKGGLAAAQFDLGRLWADGRALPPAWSHFCLSNPARRLTARAGAGRGVALNRTKAERCFRLAARAGHASAQVAVACLALALDAREAQAGAVDADGAPEYAGLGRRWDPVAAAEWLERAAAQGHPDAWFNLGALYQRGAGLQRSPAMAVRCWREAARLGSAAGQLQLGLCYLHGEEGGGKIEQSDRKAFVWLRRAAKAGEREAALWLGRLCYAGRGTAAANATRALRYLLVAADAGLAEGQLCAGALLTGVGRAGEGGVDLQGRGYARGLALLRAAAAQGSREAFFALVTRLAARGGADAEEARQMAEEVATRPARLPALRLQPVAESRAERMEFVYMIYI